MRLLAVVAVLLAAAVRQPSFVAAQEDDDAGLTDTAAQLKTVDGDVYAKRGDKTYKVSREEALSSVYTQLAGLQYKKASQSSEAEEAAQGKAGLERAKVLNEQTFSDAKAVSIDPKALTNVDCRQRCSWSGCTTYCFNAIAGVRGGRKLDNSLDETLAGLEVDLTQANRGFMARSPAAMRATPYIRSGRAYEDMAVAARGGKPMVRETADYLRSTDTDVILKKGDEVTQVSREAALASMYSELAAAEYKAGASEDPALAEAGRARAEAARDQALKDAKAVSVDDSKLAASCRPVCGWFGGCYYQVCQANAVAGVRGGRKLDTSADETLASLNTELDEVSRGFMARSPAAMRATPHIRAGRLYEQMADAVAGKKPAAEAAAPAAAEGPELSPREVYAKASPAVVVIIAAGADGAGELGTGSVIDAQGRVLTNAHVVIKDATGKPFEKVRYYLKPGKVTGDPKRDLVDPIQAKVVRYDRGLDLALIEPETPATAKTTVAFGDSESMSAGDPVIAIGHPEQGGLWTLTTGVVSTVVADLGGVKGKDAFQTDASINRGNSGGPLLDRRGRLIGVNTSMARKAADGLTITSVNFSVRSSVAKRWLENGGEQVVAAAEPAPAPAPETPKAEAPKAEAPKTEAPKPAAPAKPQILTEKKPYKIEDTIEQQMKEMEDLEKEMQEQIRSRSH